MRGCCKSSSGGVAEGHISHIGHEGRLGCGRLAATKSTGLEIIARSSFRKSVQAPTHVMSLIVAECEKSTELNLNSFHDFTPLFLNVHRRCG